MVPLIEVVLDGRANRYIEQNVATGHTLGRIVARERNLLSGVVTALLPAGTPEDMIYEFSGGLLFHLPGAETDLDPELAAWEEFSPVRAPVLAWQVSVIQEYLRGSPGRYCIFENLLYSPAIAINYGLSSRIVTYREEVYHVLSGDQASTETILEYIRDSQTDIAPVSFMVSLQNTELPLDELTSLSSEQLVTLAQRTEKIFCGAYDGEGMLLLSEIKG